MIQIKGEVFEFLEGYRVQQKASEEGRVQWPKDCQYSK